MAVEPVQTETPPPAPRSVVVDSLGVFCQYGLVYPCLDKKPQPAKWMIALADCDCDADPEDRVKAACDPCKERYLKPMQKAKAVYCKCGVRYEPALTRIADLVRIP